MDANYCAACMTVHESGACPLSMPPRVSTEHKPLPVLGYTPQSDEKTAIANELKQAEERYMRLLDKLNALAWTDKRNVAMAKSAMEDANMRAVRSIFQPTRIALPEDTNDPGAA